MNKRLQHFWSLRLAVAALSIAATVGAQSPSAPMPGKPFSPRTPASRPGIPEAPGRPSTTMAAPAPAAVAPATNAPASSLVSTNAAVQAIDADPAFQRFTNLVVHSPFLPSSQKMAGMNASSVEGAAFASALKLTGFFIQGNKVQASIEDRSQADKKYFVRAGEVIGDTEIKVAGFDLSNRAVLLEKGDEKARLEYEAAPAPPPGGKPGGPPGPLPTPPPFPPPQGARPTQTPAPAQVAGGDASGRSARRRNRQQTIERLKQMLERTTDPATQQRLQNMIGMLEKADAQDAAEGGGR